uniref:Uncharacterized protein n=1 Tax=Ascaris lumbricoides TaxID=6252 RepID=A0A0M3HFC2_ASCLU
MKKTQFFDDLIRGIWKRTWDDNNNNKNLQRAQRISFLSKTDGTNEEKMRSGG